MIKRYLPVLILSAICLAACSKKEDNEAAEEPSSPIMSVVNETPTEESQEPLRDPLQNIVTDKNDNAVDENATAAAAAATPQPQNLAGDIPPGYVQGQASAPAQGEHFADPSTRILKAQPQAGTK